MSDNVLFEPEEGEVFFAEVSNKRIDRKVKTISCINGDACEKCVLVVANLLIYVGVYGVLMVMGLN